MSILAQSLRFADDITDISSKGHTIIMGMVSRFAARQRDFVNRTVLT